MSKAFTREDDDAVDLPAPRRPLSTLPPGAKNYLTPDGAQRLRDQLEQLEKGERSSLADSADPEAKSASQIIDGKILRLRESLQSAVVVEPPSAGELQVRFGATVTVRTRAGEEVIYRIVGVDEMDIDRGWVSWLSPIAKALLNSRVGDQVRFKFPSGEDILEIREIAY